MAQCDGSGLCLTTTLVCDYYCKLIECPNAPICMNQEPQFILEFNNGVCTECVTRLGRSLENLSPSQPALEFKDEIECPVCFQVRAGAKNPRCSHYLCLICLKAIYWYDESLDGLIPRPEFPKPEQEEDYYSSPELFINDDLVNEWKRKIGTWNEHRVWYVIHNKKYLKRCPVCRA